MLDNPGESRQILAPMPTAGGAARARGLYAGVFLVALAVILLEIAYTRVFSYKLFYYFTYLIIGIALLGLGAGGVVVAVFPRLRLLAPDRLLPGCCLAAAATVLAGYWVIAGVPLNAFALIDGFVPLRPAQVAFEGTKLLAICAALFAPFLAGGVVLAVVFATRARDFHRLYFADLLGAGLGCALCVPLMASLSPPATVILAGFFFALAAVWLGGWRSPPLLAAVLPLGAAALWLALAPGRLPDPVPDAVKTLSAERRNQAPVLFSRWSPIFRVDVLAHPFTAEQGWVIAHDGLMGSVLPRFDGDLASLARFEADSRSHPFRLLPPEPSVAIIGAAGGHEILASLYFGARHVTAVELNPVTVSLLTTHFPDFTGRVAEHPRVTLVNAEGRNFMRRTTQRFELIWLVAPDSYAAMNAATAGAFVLSESYLYTREMVVDSLRRLSDDGILCAQFGEVNLQTKPIRTARYLSTARDAFRQLGITDFHRHVLVGTAPSFIPLSTVLLKRTPFSADDVARFAASAERIRGARVRPLDGPQPEADALAAVVALPEEALGRWYAAYPYDVRPVTDDSPFFWHFVSFGDALTGGSRIRGRSFEEATGERLLVALLVVALGFAAVFLLLPFVAIRRTWRAIPHKTSAGIYFAALGTGFMLFEVSLIQMLTLFLGFPTYSLSVTLFALLVFTGAGSLLSGRYGARRNLVLGTLLACLAGLVVFYQLGLPLLVDRLVGHALPVRIALAVGVLAPLGLCLGAFMPLGLGTVSRLTEHGEAFVAWAWAVNGFFSVVSSVLATIGSMVLGFRLVLLAGLAVYCLGTLGLVRLPQPAALGRRRPHADLPARAAS
jgi:hypothetical protein